jgi:hypothetical protein
MRNAGQPADAEAFIVQLRSSNGRKLIAMSTGRGYETTLTLFMEYLIDRRYGWPEVCLERFGDIPQQIFHEDNRVAHVVEYEGRPGRRPLTYDEVQALFDAADGRAEATRARGRKGALTALRDAAQLKSVYALGSVGTKPADSILRTCGVIPGCGSMAVAADCSSVSARRPMAARPSAGQS